MRDKHDHARGWFRKAESDLYTAQRTLDGDGPYDTACFHAQQVAEKYLKGLLAFMDSVCYRSSRSGRDPGRWANKTMGEDS